MKVKYLGALALGATMLVGCGTVPQSKELCEISNATMADSLAYYLGEQGAMAYWQAAAQDTTLKTEAARAAYLKGFQKGMESISEEDAYNRGVSQGMNLAMYLKTLKAEYDVDLKNDPALAGLAFGMQNDTIVNPGMLQQAIQPIGMQLDAIKSKKDKEIADKKIAEEMQKSNYQKDVNGLVYKVMAEGKGDKLENDQMVLVELIMTDVAGKSLVPTDVKPQKVVVGQHHYISMLNQVLPMMKVGSAYKVLGSAIELFGPQSRQFRLKGSDIACLEVKVVGYCDEKGELSETPIKVAKEEVKIANK